MIDNTMECERKFNTHKNCKANGLWQHSEGSDSFCFIIYASRSIEDMLLPMENENSIKYHSHVEQLIQYLQTYKAGIVYVCKYCVLESIEFNNRVVDASSQYTHDCIEG